MSESVDDARFPPAEYAYRRDCAEIEREIGFREVEPARDVDRLFAWFGTDHVTPYWQLDLPRPAFEAALAEKLDRDHVTAYVGCLDHVPMSYWERYRAIDDDLAAHYDAREDDVGVHLLVGPPEYLGQGYATALLRTLVAAQFAEEGAERVVSEPDVRNERAIRVFEKCGFERQDTVDLPEKTARLLVCPDESAAVQGAGQ